ncbi:MAG TPA: PepSY-associated TM helix domain-containing protein, partial [Telluria sp.]
MRPLFVIWHRWFGLAAAIFLFISGATGALISWDHELDAALNPTLFHAQTDGKALPGTDLATRIEAQDPRMRVTYMLTEVESEHTSLMSVEGRIDPVTGKPYELGFNQVAIDPATGVIQGKRQWGEISLSRENLLPFLYKLHYTMHLPAVGTIELGIWLMGL